ncbi:MAG: hypothetical protein ISP41_16230 [Alphaproteobacteria bacterium]|jgi:hypothetical protein|nr:hypothetical protein [Alphaproteobacteria bacterium]
MAIDPTGRFPQLPVPLIQQRPAGPTPTNDGAADPTRVQNRGQPAEAELLSETSGDQTRRRQANAPGAQAATRIPENPNPNAPRGSIIDIEV